MTTGYGCSVRYPVILACCGLLLTAEVVAAPASLQPGHRQVVRRAHYVMGTIFEITAYGADREETVAAVEQSFTAIRQADEILSHYRAESDLMRLNRSASQGTVTVDRDLYRVLEEALRFARLSEGAFDVTVGPLVRLWSEAAGRDRAPSEQEILETRKRVGSAKVELLPELQVRFAQRGLEINLGAIGKGWAVDQAVAVLRRHGVRDAFVSAGTSTVFALGDDGLGEGWEVSVRNPIAGDPLATFRICDRAVSTSAAYERYWEITGNRFGHILDPRSGQPAVSMLSATVVAPTATAADALSTAAYVMGIEEGSALFRRLNLEGLLVPLPGSGSPESRIIRRPGSSALVDCPGDEFTIDSEMSGSKARHSTLKACATSSGQSESLVWDRLLEASFSR